MHGTARYFMVWYGMAIAWREREMVIEGARGKTGREKRNEGDGWQILH